MSYKLEVRETSNQSPRSNFGAPSKPTGITIHWWGSPSAGATHDGVVSWLRGRAGGTSNRNSSAHYVVSGNRVTRLAAETRATWHSGNRRGNGTTIGIEMHPRMSAQDWATLVELCVDIEKRHGSMKYYRHMDWKATACPGVYASMIDKLVKDVNAAHAGKKPTAPSSGTSKPKPSKPAASSGGGKVGGEWPGSPLLVDGKFWLVTKRAYQRLLAPKNVGDYRGTIDGEIGPRTVKAEQRWLASLGRYRGTIDGQRGPRTIRALQRFLAAKGLYKRNVDGVHGSYTTKALQQYLNDQRKYY